MFTEFTKIGVIGAGVMGQGLAQHATACGLDVVLIDISDEILQSAIDRITSARRVARLLRQSLAPSGVIEYHTDLAALFDAQFIVENVTETESTKREVYAALTGVLPAETVISANSSVFPIAQIGDWYGRPEQVVGIHFMNPVPQIAAVEVICGPKTSQGTRTTALDLLKRLGKAPIEVGDSPGYVSNRVLMLSVNEAIRLVGEGVCSATNADRVFVECFGHRMGLLEVSDLIGLDTIMLSLIALRDQLEDDRFEPAPLLKEMVAAGRLGRKSGQGFYNYD